MCFWCDEKYELGQKCKQKQLYLIEVQEDNEGKKEDEAKLDNEEDKGDETNPQIYVHAIHGMSSKDYKTMRVTKHVNKTLSIF